MKTTTLTAFALLSLVIACQPATSEGGKKVSAQKVDPLNGPLSYSFKVTGDYSCQTGAKTFTSKEEMCAALQDEQENNTCAFTSRFEKFEKVCEPMGLKWNESAQCDIYLLKGKSNIVGKVEESNIIQKFSVCAGRMANNGWKYEAKNEISGELIRGATFEASVEPTYYNDSGHVESTFKFVRGDGKVSFTDSSHGAIFGSTTESNLDDSGPEQVRVSCYVTNVCR